MEVEPPGLLRYLVGAVIMVVGVVLPLGYMMFATSGPLRRVLISPSRRSSSDLSFGLCGLILKGSF
ncbi:unnamed protein product [Spirodela intermedia]|uniref:Uncharacterized protein n=1 Tax=Spirodela intermedia TaxID=51605 RepID=A0A7I8IZH9_SPIIN|nr:unnamed protein product [Spirodela intermedia]CAA6663288.1 unnamed protein product [Spirodela intermedia]